MYKQGYKSHISGGTSGSSIKLSSFDFVIVFTVSSCFLVLSSTVFLSFTILLKSISLLAVGSTSNRSWRILRKMRKFVDITIQTCPAADNKCSSHPLLVTQDCNNMMERGQELVYLLWKKIFMITWHLPKKNKVNLKQDLINKYMKI